ncbi:HNH endonuclease [Gordonia sp. PP30]|uniref:HNH endonuclease signature motif containing protein n=1 Tax=Gordonia sp. PP30 TaxID=2935861 RepID=UPI001FFE889E|nr:HNH endonuclease signature motif containing protein [Gordonia sp. PP30]UQE73274.1 HNH endonuclease [Gordonia sp. PP30]
MTTDVIDDAFTSRWAGIDLTAAGMVPADENDDEKAQCRSWAVYAEAAWRGQTYLYSQQLFAVGQFLDIELATLDDRVCAGEDQKDLFDPYTLAVEFFAIYFAGNRRASRALVGVAIAAAERLPATADLLRRTVISPEMFEKVAHRTDIVDDGQIMAQVDQDLADALAIAGHISERAAERIADRIVNKRDADADRKRREKARRRKNMTNRDYPDGLGGINITADAEEARLAYESVEAMIAGVCPNDPRTKGMLRSAAAIARLRRLPFTCACTDKEACTATLNAEEISERQARIIVHAVCQKSTLTGDNDEPAHLDGHGPISAGHVRDLAQRPDTLVRDLDLGALLQRRPPVTAPPEDSNSVEPVAAESPDGHDTDPHAKQDPNATAAQNRENDTDGRQEDDPSGGHAAELRHHRNPEQPDAERTDAERTDAGRSGTRGELVDGHEVPPAFLNGQAQPADPYRPTEALSVLVRALFGTCTVPGCEQPAWNCELDHCEEFNQICPASGGPTCLCNIGPKCKRHHLLKTFLGAANPEDGWVDEQWIDQQGVVWTAITLHGTTSETRAENQWLLPQFTGVRCAHQAQAPPEPPPPGPARSDGAGGNVTGGGLRAATAYKHAWRRAERARLRRARERADAAYGPPPF